MLPTFRQEDQIIFGTVAQLEKVWILVRETNPISLRDFAGKMGYSPKPFTCQAKTADLNPSRPGPYQVAGLVVSIDAWGAAAEELFGRQKIEKAQKAWESFSKVLRENHDYDVDMDRKSKHFGCVRYKGEYLYSDYDLFDVVIENQEHRSLTALERMNGKEHRRGARFYRIQSMINTRLGFDMIQHAYDAHYFAGWQAVHVFDPMGNYMHWDARQVEVQYGKWERHPVPQELKSRPWPAGVPVGEPKLKLIRGGKYGQ